MNKQKVLLYGCGEVYQKNIFWIETLYDVVGIVDKRFECSDWVHRRYTIDDGVGLIYDYVLVTSVYIDEIRKTLIKQYGIPNEKILYFSDEFLTERKVSFGERNPDITFFVLRAHWQERNNGFYNFFNRVVRAYHYARSRNYELVVDMRNYYTQYAGLEKYGYVNVWESYYEQPAAYKLEEVYQSKNVILSKFGVDWSSDWVGDIFQEKLENWVPFAELGRRYADHFRPSLELVKQINCERKRLEIEGKKVLGVLMRGTDFKRHPQGHPILHDTKEVIKDIYRVMNKAKYDAIYLATEDSSILEQFKQEFGTSLLYADQCRTDRYDTFLMNIQFERKNDGYLRGMEYCTVIELLSQCQGLIANCLCGGAMGALTRNSGKYEDIIVYDDGMY